jgi:hypothetical protein
MNGNRNEPGAREGGGAAALAGLGAVCGLASWLLIDFADDLHAGFQYEGFGLQLLPVSIYPGVVFGLVFGAFLRLRGALARPRAIGYALASGLGYAVAFHVAFYILADGFSGRESVLAYAIAGIPAGFAGSSVLGLLTVRLTGRPAPSFLRNSVIVGTAAGALLGLAGLDTHNDLWFLAFFVLWQSAYGASLLPLLHTGPRAVANA